MIRPLPPGWTRAESAHDRLVREGKVTEQTVTLDDIAADGTDELREALASTLWLAQPEYIVSPWSEISETTREQYRTKADALLAGPLADLIRERDVLLAKVQAVEALAEQWERRAVETNGWSITFRDGLARALDGTR